MKNILKRLLSHIKENYKSIILNAFVLSLFIFASCYNFPYLVYKPGGTIALDSRLYIDGKKADLGDYNLAYVSVSRGNLVNLALAKIIREWQIVKEEAIVIEDTDYDTTFKIEKIDMQNSINIAKYIAYQKAGKQVEISINSSIIYAIAKEAQTDLQVLDELVSIDGQAFNLQETNEYINNLPVGTKLTIEVVNDGKKYERYANTIELNGQKLIGVYLSNIFQVETDPKIEIKAKESEAGSSGGLMMTLAIYDALTEGDLTKGKKIVGTGTIDLDGRVGDIGGVKYKLLGANKAGADVFFIPAENYEEAKEVYDEYKMKFDLVSVEVFDDVINYFDSF